MFKKKKKLKVKKQAYCMLIFEGKKTGLLYVNVWRYYYRPIVCYCL